MRISGERAQRGAQRVPGHAPVSCPIAGLVGKGRDRAWAAVGLGGVGGRESRYEKTQNYLKAPWIFIFLSK